MSIAIRQLKLLFLYQVALGIVVTLVLFRWKNPSDGASFAVGAVLSTMNIGAIAWVWWRLMAQKTIAWTSLVIVIKYAVLLGTTYRLSQEPWFNALAAGLGFASFVIPALGAALSERD